LIDSAEQTAAETRRVLGDRHLLAPNGRTPTRHFVASDAPKQFLRMAERFLGAPIEGVETHTLG
jgi:glutamate racemase